MNMSEKLANYNQSLIDEADNLKGIIQDGLEREDKKIQDIKVKKLDQVEN